MIEKVQCSIRDMKKTGKGKEVTFVIEFEGRKVEVKRIFLGDIPSKVELLDELIRDAHFGKYTWEEFLRKVDMVADLDLLKRMYDDCVELDYKMSYLFGNYEERWVVDDSLIQ